MRGPTRRSDHACALHRVTFSASVSVRRASSCVSGGCALFAACICAYRCLRSGGADDVVSLSSRASSWKYSARQLRTPVSFGCPNLEQKHLRQSESSAVAKAIALQVVPTLVRSSGESHRRICRVSSRGRVASPSLPSCCSSRRPASRTTLLADGSSSRPSSRSRFTRAVTASRFTSASNSCASSSSAKSSSDESSSSSLKGTGATATAAAIDTNPKARRPGALSRVNFVPTRRLELSTFELTIPPIWLVSAKTYLYEFQSAVSLK